MVVSVARGKQSVIFLHTIMTIHRLFTEKYNLFSRKNNYSRNKCDLVGQLGWKAVIICLL